MLSTPRLPRKMAQCRKNWSSYLFALKPGDTDSDFFADYTPEQLDWVTANGEELSLIALDRYGER